MNYQSICRGLNKKANSEQLKKLASLIRMRKRAQEGVKNGTTVNDYFSVTAPDGIFSPIEIKPKASAQTLTKEQYNQKINRIRSSRSPYYEPSFWQGLYADLYEKGNGGLNRVSQKDEGWRNPTYDMVSMPYRLINRTAKNLFNK